jgi:hypothetical protein
MLRDTLHLLSPVIGLAANALIQVGGFRLCPALSLLKSLILGFVTGFVTVFVTESVVALSRSQAHCGDAGILLMNLLTYSALGYCYFHFINLGETARRVRILREIYDSASGLRMEELLERYNARMIVQLRMERLLRNGQVVAEKGHYVIHRRAMVRIARLISLLERIIVPYHEGR